MNSDYGHTLLLTDGILIHNEDSLQESRMREICTSGSTRGSGRLAFVLLAPPVALYSTVLCGEKTTLCIFTFSDPRNFAIFYLNLLEYRFLKQSSFVL